MGKRFWICGLVVSVAALLLDFIVHALLLDPDYNALGTLYRTEADSQAFMPWMLLAHLLMGFAMTWIYVHGFGSQRSNYAQGLRFGLGMAFFSTIPGYLVYYSVQPMPAMLVAKQVILGTMVMLLLGLLLAWLEPHRRALAEPA